MTNDKMTKKNIERDDVACISSVAPLMMLTSCVACECNEHASLLFLQMADLQ